MAKQYAGVLGSLGVAVTMARGAMVGSGFEGTAITAVAAMVGLAVVGALVGSVAEATIDQSVRDRLQTQIDLLENQEA